MKAVYFFIAALTLPILALADKHENPDDMLTVTIMANSARLEKEIAATMNREAGASAEVTVKWDTLRCLAVPASEFGQDIKNSGVCKVAAFGWQMSAQVAILANNDGQRIELIYLDIE